MEMINSFFNFIMHLDVHMVTFVALYGKWVYSILFLIIFFETALVVTPFLPGDSLLFATGALTAKATGELNIHILFLLLVVASITGNMVNYFIGRMVGPRVFRSNNSIFLNKKYLERAHRFYQEYGGKTIILARFMPIIRSFAPFVAGIGYMNYSRFSWYNIVGALLWVGSLLYVSFLFGNLPFIKDHFSTIILGIIFVSLLPPLIEFSRQLYLKPSSSKSSI